MRGLGIVAALVAALTLSACAPFMVGAVAGMAAEKYTGVFGHVADQAVDVFDGTE